MAFTQENLTAMRFDYNLPWRGAILGALFYTGLSILTVRLARDVSGIIVTVQGASVN
jgi:hypothetical protein